MGNRPIARPLALGELGWIDIDLRGQVGDRGRRKIASVTLEAGLELEELQHQREAEPGRAALVVDQLPLILLDQRLDRDQIRCSHSRRTTPSLSAATFAARFSRKVPRTTRDGTAGHAVLQTWRALALVASPAG